MDITKYEYFKRDISWLSFNFRVLMEALDKSLSVSERIKFISIYSSNLEEFYKIRIAEHKAVVKARRESDETIDDARLLIEEITEEVNRQMEYRIKALEREIVPELAKLKVVFYQNPMVRPAHREFVNNFFREEIFPFLYPVPLDRENINVFLRDNRLYMAIKMYKRMPDGVTSTRPYYYMVKMPYSKVPRFIELPQIDGVKFVMFIDDIVKSCIGKMFPGYLVECSYSFKISRDADILVDDVESDEIVEQLRKKLKKRKIGDVCRFVYDRHMPKEMLDKLMDTFGIKEDELVPGDKHLSLEDLSHFPDLGLPRCVPEKPKPLVLKKLSGGTSMLSYISGKDLLLHYPYHSFDHFINFLSEASVSPDVTDIMLTQYRVAVNSEVINTLISASRNGKKVTVFVELKARFDEENNIATAEMMRRAGINIINSIPGLKVHAKVALVKCKSDDNTVNKGFAYIGTGNFNEDTAQIYADCGLFTANNEIVSDLCDLFSVLNREKDNVEFRRLLVPRFNLLPALKSKIEREIENVANGREGRIILKMNALQDEAMINELYRASEAGVNIDLIVRGICCLKPNQPYSRNIRITRIVDSFLEHARVWYFGNNGNPEVFMGSPDWMKRNLYKRIEAVVPVLDNDLKSELIDMLDLQLRDNVKACFVDENLTNIRKPVNGNERIRCQYDFYEYLKKKNI